MCQIHTQWSHFSRPLVTVDFDDRFNTKICSVDDVIIVSLYISMVLAKMGLHICPKFIHSGHTFQGCWLLLILMMFQHKSMVS